MFFFFGGGCFVLFLTEDVVLRGGETIHFAGTLLKFRKQTTQNLQEASETDQIH